MSIHRKASWLAAWGLVLRLAATLQAQDTPQVYDDHYALGNAEYSNAAPAVHRPFSPFNPLGVTQKFQPFAPADISDYGNGPKPKLGFFASYERVYWSISKPRTTDIGSTAAVGLYEERDVSDVPIFEQNSYTTDFLKSLFTYGNRYEVGYMDANDYGWLVSAISQVSQNQDCTLTDAQVLFNDPQRLLRGFRDSFPQADGWDDDINLNGIFGRDGLDSDGNGVPDTVFPTVDWGDAIQYLPRFDIITAFNHTSVNGVEVMRMYRAPRLHNGGVFELLYGARLLAIEDRFRLLGMNTAAHAQPPNGGGNQVTTPGRLDDIFLENRIENNIVGPQIGGRWYNQRGRWITSLEGRFMAGANFQNGRQRVSYNATSAMNPQNMALLPPFSAKTERNDEEFAPVTEWRFNTSWQATRTVALKMGYTALYAYGISRASNRIDYTLPHLGINGIHMQEGVFIHGVSFGVEVNR